MPTARPGNAAKIMLRNSVKLFFVNISWSLAAMAGALSLALTRSKNFIGEPTANLWIGDGTTLTTARDVTRVLYVYSVACLINVALVAGLTVFRMI